MLKNRNARIYLKAMPFNKINVYYKLFLLKRNILNRDGQSHSRKKNKITPIKIKIKIKIPKK